jgi:hypothetical protein
MHCLGGHINILVISVGNVNICRQPNWAEEYRKRLLNHIFFLWKRPKSREFHWQTKEVEAGSFLGRIFD